MNILNSSAKLPAICGVAFKEWAVVCEALATGRQSIILRKGGIHEGRDGFRVQHDAFWLYPTNFHQQPAALVADAEPLLAIAAAQRPAAGEFRLSRFATVEEVIELSYESQLAALRPLHVWSDATLHDRFHYRRPGLFLLVTRVWNRNEPHALAEGPEMVGCKSWVELPQTLTTDGLTPVLADAEFATQRERVWKALQIAQP